MLCEKCKNNMATYHSSVNINGKVSQTHLCNKCAMETTNESNFKLFHLGNIFIDDINELNFPNTKVNFCECCDVCGMEYNTFLKTGLLGCSNCYKAFHNKLTPMIQTMQNSTMHIGKNPHFNESIDENISIIKTFEYKLKQAVADEDYEKAINLKKQINKLKHEEE